LLACFGATQLGGYNATLCPWFVTPRKPGPNPITDPLGALFYNNPAVRDAVCATFGSVPTTLCGTK